MMFFGRISGGGMDAAPWAARKFSIAQQLRISPVIEKLRAVLECLFIAFSLL
jgi:hypothetical protein